MADLSKIREKLAQLNNAQVGSSQKKEASPLLWKPTRSAIDPKTGKVSSVDCTVRLLPYPTDPDSPIQAVHFYYKLGRTWLAPSQFGRPDPAVEAYNATAPRERLPEREFKADLDYRKPLKSEVRYYALILVRGQESEGPKYFSFTKKVLEDIERIFGDEDYGDISDLQTGTDITITFIPKEINGTNFDSIKVTPRRNSTVATTDAGLLKTIKSVPPVHELFDEPTYDELKAAVDRFLSVPKVEPTQSQASAPEPVKEEKDPLAGIDFDAVFDSEFDLASHFDARSLAGIDFDAVFDSVTGGAATSTGGNSASGNPPGGKSDLPF